MRVDETAFHICVFCHKGYATDYAVIRGVKGKHRYIYFHAECYEKSLRR